MTYHETTLELLEHIYDVMLADTDNKWKTRKQITDSMGMAKSPHVLECIEWLTSEGWFEKRQDQLGSRIPHFEYRLTDKRPNGHQIESYD